MLSSVVALVLLASGPVTELGQYDDPFTLTVSGGVSLGTYESGLTWTLARLAKAKLAGEDLGQKGVPSLLAVTGASAGSINSLLAGAMWCGAPDDKLNVSVDQNMLRETWVSVGLDALLPQNTSVYVPDDGLLASAALMPLLDRIRERVFRPGGMRFEPGCRLPVGFTVTRVTPEKLDVSGLTVPVQRAVFPLLFEVDDKGRVRLQRQALASRTSVDSLLRLADSADGTQTFTSPDSLFQALLASGAFPLAFGPRPLCECAVACSTGAEVSGASCPGPDAQHPLNNLTCSAYANAAGGREMSLCKSYFVDGGVFDNAPVGLAIDQAAAFARWRLLRPLTALFLDPDTRRLQPPVKDVVNNTGAGISGALDLAFTLVGTARQRQLAESVGSRQWNLTTRNLLWREAFLLTESASVQLHLMDLEGQSTEVAPPPAFRGVLSERIRFSRVLYSCVRRLAVPGADPAAALEEAVCAAAAREVPIGDPLTVDPAQLAKADVPLSDEELVRMAESLTSLSGESSPRRRMEDAVLRSHTATSVERIQVAQFSTDRAQVAAATVTLLTDELPRMTHGLLTEAALRRLRTTLLQYVAQARYRAERTNRLANALVLEQLRVVAGTNVPLGLGVTASKALEAMASVPETLPFAVQPLQPVLEALHAAAPGVLPPPVRLAWTQLERLVQLRGRLGTLTSESFQAAQDATELEHESGGERKLVLTTRFSPLAGSQLANFGGFLDRPLREADYYIGVYDGLHQVAEHWCDLQDPYETDRPAPVRKQDGSGDLDFTQTATQACLGAAMEVAARWLRLFDSSKAAVVVKTLARRELAAWLGSAAEGERMLKTPQWQWLGAEPPVLKSVGSMGKAVEVLLSQPIACEQGALEKLCFDELSFDAFLEGLVAEGYVADSDSMRTALESRRRFFTATLKRAVDRAATISIQTPIDDSSGTESMVNLGIGATELLTRSQTYETGVRFVFDPSSIPSEPLADGSYVPIVLAHLIPFRVALDIVGGGVAFSWLEPELWLARWFSFDSTLQLVDIQFSPSRTATTLGVRATGHVGGVSLGVGPRWSLYWTGSNAYNWGIEFDLAFLQDRFGVSFGFRSITPSGWQTPFVALTIADLNGALYWLIPAAWRSGR
ncbi:MAG: patatin-like phospholipase family protein [Myxococcaceae bacterium]